MIRKLRGFFKNLERVEETIEKLIRRIRQGELRQLCKMPPKLILGRSEQKSLELIDRDGREYSRLRPAGFRKERVVG